MDPNVDEKWYLHSLRLADLFDCQTGHIAIDQGVVGIITCLPCATSAACLSALADVDAAVRRHTVWTFPDPGAGLVRNTPRGTVGWKVWAVVLLGYARVVGFPWTEDAGSVHFMAIAYNMLKMIVVHA